MPYALMRGGWLALGALALVLPLFALSGQVWGARQLPLPLLFAAAALLGCRGAQHMPERSPSVPPPPSVQLICWAFDLMPASVPRTYPELGRAAAGRWGVHAVLLFSFMGELPSSLSLLGVHCGGLTGRLLQRLGVCSRRAPDGAVRRCCLAACRAVWRAHHSHPGVLAHGGAPAAARCAARPLGAPSVHAACCIGCSTINWRAPSCPELMLPPPRPLLALLPRRAGLGPLSAMQLAAAVSTACQLPLLFVDLRRLSRLAMVGGGGAAWQPCKHSLRVGCGRPIQA